MRNRRRAVLRTAAIALAVVAVATMGGVYAFTNVPLMSDATFERRLDEAIAGAESWITEHKWEIASTKNTAMYLVMQECVELHDQPLLRELVDRYLRETITPACWRRVLDRDCPVDVADVQQTIERERIDNRWMLHAVAPDTAELPPGDLEGLYDASRWKGRQLTHQLMALTQLRRSDAATDESEAMIEQLSRRLAGELALDVAVVDLYIQKIAVVLDAGEGDRVRRRWVERVIANQRDDGGWNDRWCRVFTSFRRPALDWRDPPSDQHATIQALWLMYLVKYRYPKRFGLDGATG